MSMESSRGSAGGTNMKPDDHGMTTCNINWTYDDLDNNFYKYLATPFKSVWPVPWIPSAFTSIEIPGKSVDIYDSNGNEVRVSLNWRMELINGQRSDGNGTPVSSSSPPPVFSGLLGNYSVPPMPHEFGKNSENTTMYYQGPQNEIIPVKIIRPTGAPLFTALGPTSEPDLKLSDVKSDLEDSDLPTPTTDPINPGCGRIEMTTNTNQAEIITEPSTPPAENQFESGDSSGETFCNIRKLMDAGTQTEDPSPPNTSEFPCTIPNCSKSCKTLQGLAVHISRGHRIYPCNHGKCGATFQKNSLLEKHIVRKHGGKSKKCPRCNEKYVETWDEGKHDAKCRATIVENPVHEKETKRRSRRKQDLGDISIVNTCFFETTPSVFNSPSTPMTAGPTVNTSVEGGGGDVNLGIADIKQEIPSDDETMD